MDKFLVDRIDMTIENYRLAKESLRNDGDILNHFASLVFSHYEMSIPIDRVREIRKIIKINTTRMSPFRGDSLYILSLLIATIDREKQDKLIKEILEVSELLSEEGFVSSSYLVLTAYCICRYGRRKDKQLLVDNIKDMHELLKNKYSNITNEEDYVLCALWAINDVDVATVDDFVENIFEHIADSNIRSKNGVQGLANAIILNGSSGDMYRVMEFITQLEKRKIKIGYQFLPLIGILSNNNPRKYADIVEGVIAYMCDEEAEYEYYIDKGFRTIISLVVVSFCTMSNKKRYIDELLAQGIIAFINSKNKGIFEEVLS